MQEGWFAFRVPAIVALWKIWCVCAFVCLSLLWSQSVFHFLPVWLIIFSIVASLQKKNPLIYFAFPFFPLFLPSFHSWHILAFLPLLLYCLMNVLFYDICFSTLLFLCDCFPFLSLICFQALFYVFPLSTFFIIIIHVFCSLSMPPISSSSPSPRNFFWLPLHTLHHSLLSPDTYCWVTPWLFHASLLPVPSALLTCSSSCRCH